jgi:VCBS repeat-containing protein
MSSDSDIQSLLVSDPSAEDTDAVCETQTKASAGALTLNGAAVTTGVANFSPARQAAIVATVAATRLFTIVGADEFGRAQTVVVSYTAVMSQVITTEYWSSITSITVSGAAVDVTVGNDASFAAVISASRSRLKGVWYVQGTTTNKSFELTDNGTTRFECVLVGKGGVADVPDSTHNFALPGNGILFENNMVLYGEQGDIGSINFFFQR